MEQSTIMRHAPKTEWGFTFVAMCQCCPILFEQVSSVLGPGATTLYNLLLPEMRLDCCARKESMRMLYLSLLPHWDERGIIAPAVGHTVPSAECRGRSQTSLGSSGGHPTSPVFWWLALNTWDANKHPRSHKHSPLYLLCCYCFGAHVMFLLLSQSQQQVLTRIPRQIYPNVVYFASLPTRLDHSFKRDCHISLDGGGNMFSYWRQTSCHWPVVLDMVLHVVETYTLVESNVVGARLHWGAPVYS